MNGETDTEYRNLFYCYQSGQMTEQQWQEHLKEDGWFSLWVSLEQAKREMAVLTRLIKEVNNEHLHLREMQRLDQQH